MDRRLAGGTMSAPTLFGAEYSVYTRIVRMILHFKKTPYQFDLVDIFNTGTIPETYLSKHPFVKIPAFAHNGIALYETNAICRYIDDVYPSPPLFPGTPLERARTNQIVSILDNYAYPSWVWGIYVERIEPDGPTDESKISGALETAKTCCNALESLMGPGPGLISQQITLADFYAISMMHYLVQTPEGQSLLSQHHALRRWWQTISEFDWVTDTMPEQLAETNSS